MSRIKVRGIFIIFKGLFVVVARWKQLKLFKQLGSSKIDWAFFKVLTL